MEASLVGHSLMLPACGRPQSTNTITIRAFFVALATIIAFAVLPMPSATPSLPLSPPPATPSLLLRPPPATPSLPLGPPPSATPSVSPSVSSGTDCTTELFNLTSCLTYVEAASTVPAPDKECCPALAGLMDSNPICLCELLAGGAEEFGIKIDDSKVLKLPSICKVETPPPSTCRELGYNISNVEGMAPSPAGTSGRPSLPVINNPPSSSPTRPENLVGSSSPSHKILVVGLTVAASVLALAMVFLVLLRMRRKKILKEEQEVLHGVHVKPEIFSYSEMNAATEDFNPSNILGEGGYGLVFKGELLDGRKVAVKKLSPTSSQGKQQFLAEIATISVVQHRNLVKLHGCCIEGDKRILVYEFLENKSLDQALFGKNNLHLNWTQRFDICLGVARGLAYLHEESSIRIVHRDVKASNILLDTNLKPKISDFGLAKLYDVNNTHVSTKVAGTIGYLAPEYAMRGHLTEKADVYAFGVLTLEILAGRPNSDQSLDTKRIYLLEWAWYLYENKREPELVDRSLSSFNKDEVDRVVRVALLCTQASPAQRPPMSRVVAMLTGYIKVTEITMKPSYLADWQYHMDSNNSYVTDYTSTSTQVTANSQGTKSSSASTPGNIMSTPSALDSLMNIEEGR